MLFVSGFRLLVGCRPACARCSCILAAEALRKLGPGTASPRPGPSAWPPRSGRGRPRCTRWSPGTSARQRSSAWAIDALALLPGGGERPRSQRPWSWPPAPPDASCGPHPAWRPPRTCPGRQSSSLARWSLHRAAGPASSSSRSRDSSRSTMLMLGFEGGGLGVLDLFIEHIDEAGHVVCVRLPSVSRFHPFSFPPQPARQRSPPAGSTSPAAGRSGSCPGPWWS